MENIDKIFLADQRGFIQNSSLKRRATFNFDGFYSDQNIPFKNLFVCNDDEIAAEKLTFYLAKENSLHLIIPITGSIDIVAKNKEFPVETGQVQLLSLEKGEVLEISNPDRKEPSHYVHLGMINHDFVFFKDQLFTYDFKQNQDKLIPIISGYKFPFKLNAGYFAKGKVVMYGLQETENSLFSFIIDGTFEINNRLLNARDGLALSNTENIKFEALSDKAMLLSLELFPLLD